MLFKMWKIWPPHRIGRLVSLGGGDAAPPKQELGSIQVNTQICACLLGRGAYLLYLLARVLYLALCSPEALAAIWNILGSFLLARKMR